MAVLMVTRGLPGSGKSTWAAEWVKKDHKRRVRVNRDDLRDMMDCGEYIKGLTEPRIVRAQHAIIRQNLLNGNSVICDDTNLPERTMDDLRDLALECGATLCVRDMRDVPLETCLSRNALREGRRCVPEDKIREMHERWIASADPAGMG
jgi:predicted kinase